MCVQWRERGGGGSCKFQRACSSMTKPFLNVLNWEFQRVLKCFKVFQIVKKSSEYPEALECLLLKPGGRGVQGT